MKKAKWIFLIFILLGLVSYVIIRLNYAPTMVRTTNGFITKEVLAQLLFLESELENGADSEMQVIFPEGFVFIQALYGLTWANVVINSGKDSTVYRSGIRKISTSLEKLKSNQGWAPFQEDLPLTFGAFYRGWSNYLLAKKLEAQYPKDRDSADINEFISNCEEIYSAYDVNEFIYLESYLGDVWPADNIVLLASLAMHDRMFTPKYKLFLAKKVSQIQTILDPKTGLIPHSVTYDQVLEGARGSSQSLLLVFLSELDADFALKQYALFKKHFVDHRLGLLGIREYPYGTEGDGDIDAGPILWDIGGSASIVSIASAQVNHDEQLSHSLRNSIETFGVPFYSSSKKKYLFGILPMADAFIAWVHSFDKPS